MASASNLAAGGKSARKNDSTPFLTVDAALSKSPSATCYVHPERSAPSAARQLAWVPQ